MTFSLFLVGIMMAVDTIVEKLKNMSKQVTTPEEIAQVSLDQTLLSVYTSVHSFYNRTIVPRTTLLVL